MRMLCRMLKYSRVLGPDMPTVNCIIDSGAYTAWKSGKPINIAEYCKFLKANQDWITTSVALDVINPGDPDDAAKRSFENLLYMRKQGLDPVPVFHAGEKLEWLHRMLDLGCTYIGLSGSSILARQHVNDWYAAAWDNLVDRSGKPVVKAHAFGEGRLESLVAFPWYSADTASWLYAAERTGTLLIGDKLAVSMRNDKKSTAAQRDISDLNETEAEVVDKLLKSMGLSSAALTDKMGGRILRNVSAGYTYSQLQKTANQLNKRVHKPASLFRKTAPAKYKSVAIAALRLHLVVGGNALAYVICHEVQHYNILASYAHMLAGNVVETAKHTKAFVSNPQESMLTMPRFQKPYNILRSIRK